MNARLFHVRHITSSRIIFHFISHKTLRAQPSWQAQGAQINYEFFFAVLTTTQDWAGPRGGCVSVDQRSLSRICQFQLFFVWIQIIVDLSLCRMDQVAYAFHYRPPPPHSNQSTFPVIPIVTQKQRTANWKFNWVLARKKNFCGFSHHSRGSGSCRASRISLKNFNHFLLFLMLSNNGPKWKRF